jgi:hypothetical protein
MLRPITQTLLRAVHEAYVSDFDKNETIFIDFSLTNKWIWLSSKIDLLWCLQNETECEKSVVVVTLVSWVIVVLTAGWIT